MKSLRKEFCIGCWINVKLNSELDTKYSAKEYGAHFARWLPGEIEKRKKLK
jgi:hypothetical protein